MNCPLCLSSETALFYKDSKYHASERIFFKCNDCFLIYTHEKNRLERSEEKKRYDLHENDPKDPGYLKFLSQLTDSIKPALHRQFKGLDYGCGPGPAISNLLGEVGCSVKNYDPFYFNESDLLGQKYDFITCTETAEHFFSPREELLKLDKMLRGKGSFLAVMTEVVPSESGFADWHYYRDPTHVSFYQERTLEWIRDWMSWEMKRPRPNVVIYSK